MMKSVNCIIKDGKLKNHLKYKKVINRKYKHLQ